MTATIEDRLVIGDASVLKEIYAQHGSLIHTIAYQLQGPAADQFTISTFIEAWRKRRDFDPSRGTVQAWLLRRLRSQLSNNEDYAAEVIDRVVVTASLARMEPTRREILLAGAVTETGATTELAQRLNLPVGTVRAHLRRGMEILQSELADSRSDGDTSSLVDIVRSRRLETEVVRPDSMVWDAIWTAAGEEGETEADGGGFDAYGGRQEDGAPVTPDPFESLRDQGPSLDRRRPPVALGADGVESADTGTSSQAVGGNALVAGAATAEVGQSDADADDDLSSSSVPGVEGTDVLDDVPPTLRGTTPVAAGPDDDPTLLSDDTDDGDVEHEGSALDDSMVDVGPWTGDEAHVEPGRSILEPSEEQGYDDRDTAIEVEPNAPADSDPGPITEADRSLERLRPSIEDAVDPGRNRTIAIAGVIVALLVLMLMLLIVL